MYPRVAAWQTMAMTITVSAHTGIVIRRCAQHGYRARSARDRRNAIECARGTIFLLELDAILAGAARATRLIPNVGLSHPPAPQHQRRMSSTDRAPHARVDARKRGRRSRGRPPRPTACYSGRTPRRSPGDRARCPQQKLAVRLRSVRRGRTRDPAHDTCSITLHINRVFDSVCYDRWCSILRQETSAEPAATAWFLDDDAPPGRRAARRPHARTRPAHGSVRRYTHARVHRRREAVA